MLHVTCGGGSDCARGGKDLVRVGE
jgi:hypothetical protein